MRMVRRRQKGWVIMILERAVGGPPNAMVVGCDGRMQRVRFYPVPSSQAVKKVIDMAGCPVEGP